MEIRLNNEWLWFSTGSSRLELRLNGGLECNIKRLKRILNDVDDKDRTKEVYLLYDFRINNWRRKDLLEAIKVAELFLPNSRKDRKILETLPYNILQEILYRSKGE